MKKFVFVMNIPSPYRIHLLTEVWRQLKARGVEMHVHFMARGHKDRPKSWLNPKIDFPHTYWKDYGFSEFHFNPGLVREIFRNPPDYLVCGSSFDTFTGVLIQLSSKVPVKMCWLEGNTKTPGRLTGLAGWFKRLVMGKCIFAPVPGSDAAKYIGLHQALTKNRMPKPVYLPNLVDETRFCGTAIQIAPHDYRLCLIPARLEPVKGLVPFLQLVDADMLKGWKIVIMGQGSLKAEIEALISSKGLKDIVSILEYVDYNEMPQWYAKADLVLLPSIYDPNPLTCVETLHSGKPLALSCMAGNVEEAVTEEVVGGQELGDRGQELGVRGNGWVLPVMDKESFRSKLKEVFATPKERLAEMGRVSRESNAQFWNTKKSIERFLDETLG